MNTLIWFVILYWVISVGIGLYAARYVNNSKDYAVAGRSLPMYVVTATVFATWFGSEAVLGISSRFFKGALKAWSRIRLVLRCVWCWWGCFLPSPCTA